MPFSVLLGTYRQNYQTIIRFCFCYKAITKRTKQQINKQKTQQPNKTSNNKQKQNTNKQTTTTKSESKMTASVLKTTFKHIRGSKVIRHYRTWNIRRSHFFFFKAANQQFNGEKYKYPYPLLVVVC